MLQFSRDIDLEMAEDIVQDAFCSALSMWKEKGIPENPSGWIYTVCRHTAINILKRKKKFINPFENNDQTIETYFYESAFDDEQLRLLFACANPRLTAQTQVVITLKYVVNLRVESIARALGLTVNGIDKLLVRARQKIKMENIFLKEPSATALQSRLPVVHKILYLIFNEGYKASSGKELIRYELCEESLLMTKTLLDKKISDADTSALYALMLFNSARLNTRFTAGNQLTDLEEQNRSQWNTGLIALGNYNLRQARSEGVSSYHYEAAIAYLHCRAKSFETTDWQTIVQLYEKLLAIENNLFIQLNYGIALYYASRKEQAFSTLHSLQKTFLKDHYLFHTALGKLYLLEGDRVKGKHYLLHAQKLTQFKAEKNFIENLLKREQETERSIP